MQRDLKSHIDVVPSLPPAARTNGTSTGSAVDLQNYGGAVVVFEAGAWTDGAHTPSVFDSADGTTYAAAAAADLQGAPAAISGTAQQNAVQRIGYIGGKRYLKAMLVSATATTGAVVGASVIRGYPNLGPLA